LCEKSTNFLNVRGARISRGKNFAISFALAARARARSSSLGPDHGSSVEARFP
jgi:hypothetical protein